MKSAMTTQSGPMLVDNGMADDFSNDLRSLLNWNNASRKRHGC